MKGIKYILFSLQVEAEIKKYSTFLELNLENIPDVELPIYLNKALESENLKVRLTAENIARRLGRNLAFILLTLKRGDKINKLKINNSWEDHINMVLLNEDLE